MKIKNKIIIKRININLLSSTKNQKEETETQDTTILNNNKKIITIKLRKKSMKTIMIMIIIMKICQYSKEHQDHPLDKNKALVKFKLQK